MNTAKKRSSAVQEGATRAPHRSLLHALGWDAKSMGKPVIGIANSYSELIPGHRDLRRIAECVREGIWSEGGVACEFGTIGVCDGLAMGHAGMKYSLPSRDLIADSIEIVAQAHALDGLVLVVNCDKIVPGHADGCRAAGHPLRDHLRRPDARGKLRRQAGRTGGGLRSGRQAQRGKNERCGAGAPGVHGLPGVRLLRGTLHGEHDELSLRSAGNGAPRATAASPPCSPTGRSLAREAGRAAVRAVKEGLTPRKILTRAAFMNAVALDMALGGSTNTALHLPAIAASAGVALSLDDFDAMSAKVPHLCSLAPSGPLHAEPAFRRRGDDGDESACRDGRVDGKALTVTGRPAGGVLRRSPEPDGTYVALPSKPYHAGGGLVVLKGNLARRGAS